MRLLFEILKDLGVVADQLRIRLDDRKLFVICQSNMFSLNREETYDWHLCRFEDSANSTITYSRFNDIDRGTLGREVCFQDIRLSDLISNLNHEERANRQCKPQHSSLR